MTLMLIVILTSTILLSVLINLVMLKPYYVMKEKKHIREAYYKIQRIFQDDTVNKEDVDQIARDYDYRIMISDPMNQMVYSSEGEQGVMYKDLKNILKTLK